MMHLEISLVDIIIITSWTRPIAEVGSHEKHQKDFEVRAIACTRDAIVLSLTTLADNLYYYKLN